MSKYFVFTDLDTLVTVLIIIIINYTIELTNLHFLYILVLITVARFLINEYLKLLS